jgi:YD repeat-containing protein
MRDRNLKLLVLGSLFSCCACLASSPDITAASVSEKSDTGMGEPENHPGAIAACQTNVAGVKLPSNFEYVHRSEIWPAGADWSSSVALGGAACTASCAFDDRYNSVAAACAAATDKNANATCPGCVGDSIYPSSGARRQSVDLGIAVGWTPVTISYDAERLLPQNDHNAPIEVSASPSFGDHWQSNLHKSLAIWPSATASGARVGSQYGGALVAGRGTRVDRAVKLTRAGAGSGWTLIDQRALTEEVYDASGALVSMSRASGGSLAYGYVSGLLTTVTDQFGRTVKFDYERPSDVTLPERINLVTAPDGSQLHVEYTDGNMLKVLTWADSSFVTFAYEVPAPNRLPTGAANENGGTCLPTTCDVGGLAQLGDQGDGPERMLSGVCATPPSCQTKTNALNPDRACDEYRLAPPTSTEMTAPHPQTATVDAAAASGSVDLSNTSQPAGNSGAAITTSNAYDAAGNVISRDDSNGRRSCFAYDTLRDLQTVALEGLAGATGAQPKACPANLATYVPSTADAAHQEHKTTTVWHPDWALKVREARPLKILTWVYNGQVDPIAGGRVNCVVPTALLPDGTPLAVLCRRYEQATTDQTGASGLSATVAGPPRLWAYTYNQYGQVLTATSPKRSATDALPQTTTYTYYASTSFSGDVGHTIGDLRTMSNELNQVVDFTAYDLAGRLLSSTDANSIVRSMTYWPSGRLHTTVVTPPTGVPVTTTYDYWPTGQLKTMTLPDASRLNFTYDTEHPDRCQGRLE